MSKSKNLFYLVITLLIVSCSKPPPPTLSKEEKNTVDSLYRRGVDSIKKIAIANCDSLHSSIYNHAIDSIEELRKEEIESILSQ